MTVQISSGQHKNRTCRQYKNPVLAHIAIRKNPQKAFLRKGASTSTVTFGDK